MKRILLLLSAIMMAVCSFAQAKLSATPLSFGNNFVFMGETIKVPISVTNTGTSTIGKLTYTLIRDGEEVASKNALVTIGAGNTASISISFKADTEARKSPCTITITGVNGKPNESEEKTASGNIITITENSVCINVFHCSAMELYRIINRLAGTKLNGSTREDSNHVDTRNR